MAIAGIRQLQFQLGAGQKMRGQQRNILSAFAQCD